jgi:hypothetical protein
MSTVEKTVKSSSKIPLDIATKEVNKWLDFKKVSPSKREAKADEIKQMAEYISEGYLVLKDNMHFTHNLKFPLETEDNTLSVLNYKARVDAKTIHVQLQGVKPTDVTGMLHAYAAAVSGSPKGVIQGLDTEDLAIATTVAHFFL